MPMPIDPGDKQEQMVREQIIARGVKCPRLIEAMKWLPRERFFPKEIVSHAYDDAAAPIGHGQTISQPYIVALMTEALNIRPTDKVLEIGTGSGYQAALLGKLAGEVYTIERVKVFLDEAFERLSSLHIHNVHFRFGDGSTGWEENSPFDRILITAGLPEVGDGVFDQLADGGICVAPVGGREDQELIRYTKQNGRIDRHVLCNVRFVPLIGKGGWPT